VKNETKLNSQTKKAKKTYSWQRDEKSTEMSRCFTS